MHHIMCSSLSIYLIQPMAVGPLPARVSTYMKQLTSSQSHELMLLIIQPSPSPLAHIFPTI